MPQTQRSPRLMGMSQNGGLSQFFFILNRSFSGRFNRSPFSRGPQKEDLPQEGKAKQKPLYRGRTLNCWKEIRTRPESWLRNLLFEKGEKGCLRWRAVSRFGTNLYQKGSWKGIAIKHLGRHRPSRMPVFFTQPFTNEWKPRKTDEETVRRADEETAQVRVGASSMGLKWSL